MRLICELSGPCPALHVVKGKDVCLKEEGECEYQRLEEPNEDIEEIENFVINYKNGTSKTVNKGFFCKMEETDKECNLTFIMADVSGKELYSIVSGCIQLAAQMGVLDKNE